MNQQSKPVTVGIVGSGYGAILHGGGYAEMGGVDIRLKTLGYHSNPEKAQSIASRFGFEGICGDYEKMLADPELDVIDLTVPPSQQIPMAKLALEAGKNIICEKPLTGYFGNGARDIGRSVPKSVMYEKVLEEMDGLKAAVEKSGKKFMYAENFVYASPVQKAAEIIRAKKSKLVLMSGEATIIGSSSALAGQWKNFGGGTLMRNGIHPLTGMLWLKRESSRARGEDVFVTGVTADCGAQTQSLTEQEHCYIHARPEDVEDVAVVTVTFSDGTKAITLCSDGVLGGSRYFINVYGHDMSLVCNLGPANILNTYFMDENGIEDMNISEMLPQKTGWNQAFVSDEIIRGYAGEMRSFMEALAFDKRPDTDFELAYQAMKVIYAAYRSAEEGKRIDLTR